MELPALALAGWGSSNRGQTIFLPGEKLLQIAALLCETFLLGHPSRLLLSLCPFPFHHPSAVLEILGRFSNEPLLPTIPLFASFPLHKPPTHLTKCNAH